MFSLLLQPTLAFQASEGWSPAGHAEGLYWLELFQTLAPWLFAALVVLLLVQAWRKRKHYRAVETLDLEAVEGLRRAVAEAESQTVGEIGVVVLERSDRHPAAAWIGAVVLTALASLACAHHLEWLPLPLVVLSQFLIGSIAHRCVGLVPDLRRRFVSSARAAEMAEEQALQEFHTLGLRDTVGRTGVLLFVSLFERQVVVLADEGIAEQVEPDVWVEVDRAVLGGAKRNRLEEGLRRGIALVGEILTSRFPAESGGENQVHDHVIVRRE